MPDVIRVTVSNPSYTARVSTDNFRVATVGYQGPAGTGSYISVACGETISAYQAVALINGLAYIADPTDLTHANRVIGLATQSGNSGDIIRVAQQGVVSSGSFVTNSVYYINTNGNLTTTQLPVGAVWTKLMGVGKSDSVVIINMGETVYL
jgi:hypothetical protein